MNVEGEHSLQLEHAQGQVVPEAVEQVPDDPEVKDCSAMLVRTAESCPARMDSVQDNNAWMDSVPPEWPETTAEAVPQISGEELLAKVAGFIEGFVALTPAQAHVIALWVFHTHAISASDATPYLGITSAEKQSGKTRLLEVLELLVDAPWFTGKVTAAALIRKVENGVTLLLDESDAAFKGNKEYAETLRGVLNSGHRRSGVASLCVGQGANQEVKDFQVFGPKAIAGIGTLPDTVADRCIPIRLKRKNKGEEVSRFRRRNVEPQSSQLRRQIAAWAVTAISDLREARPDLPDVLSDRQQDGVEPLLAIADLIGGECPMRARAALVEIFGGPAAADDFIGRNVAASTYLPRADVKERRAGEFNIKFNKHWVCSQLLLPSPNCHLYFRIEKIPHDSAR